MARTRTLLQLRGDVEGRADLPPSTASTFITSTLLNRWINQSVRRFVGMLISAYGENYFAKSGTINVVADTTEYALPSDFFQHLYFRVTIGAETYRIERADMSELDNDPTGNPGWSSGGPVPRYRFLGQNIKFTPTPKAAHTVTHVYVPTLVVFNTGGTPIVDLSADTDYLDGYNGWEEWVILDAAIKARIRSEEDASDLRIERNEIRDEILEHAKNRDNVEPARVRRAYPESLL